MVIEGRRWPSAGSFEVVNPATEGLAGMAPSATRQDLDAAMAAAQGAFPSWSIDEDERRRVLIAIADALVAAAERIGPILTAESGHPLGHAVREVHGAAAWFRYYADLELPREILELGPGTVAEIRRRPLGVVAAITPWNYPLALASWKLAPALRAGNTVVLKPSPFTPLATLALGEVLAEVLPAGVLNVVTGGDELGAWMTAHPVPRKVSFTGSVASGKAVAVAASADLKRITLELGGNDAAIVLDDADLSAAADGLFAGAFANSGQVCSAIKRVYVPEARYDEFVEALAARANASVMGDPLLDRTQLGPLSTAPQYERVLGLLDDALRKGAVAAAGGAAVDGPGYFVEPTILSGINEGVALVDEEQFGPVLPVMAYGDIDEAVERANGTMYGLGGSVWSSDPERAAEVAARLECGTAWVNTHLALSPFQPFGGLKWSGLGVENGPWGLASFTDIQVLHRPVQATA
jgi:acyl-CoA reductase-like NAD-dependent aldehyde dehydrogenase